MNLNSAELAALLDSTILAPTATEPELAQLLAHAVSAGCQICVNESRLGTLVKLCENLPEDSHRPLISSVIGFPLGSTTTGIKVHSARTVLSVGADEIDMVANIGFLKDQNYQRYEDDIHAVADAVADLNAASGKRHVLKVIIETCYLTQDEKRRAAATVANISRELNLDVFVKTSTGFGTPAEGVAKGATIEDVALLRKECGPYNERTNRVGIKASGGVKDRAGALAMIEAACALNSSRTNHLAVRIGTSSAASILLDPLQ